MYRIWIARGGHVSGVAPTPECLGRASAIKPEWIKAARWIGYAAPEKSGDVPYQNPLTGAREEGKKMNPSYEKFLKGKFLTRKQAIDAQCFECNGESRRIEDDCLGKSCPLYQWSPWGKSLFPRAKTRSSPWLRKKDKTGLIPSAT